MEVGNPPFAACFAYSLSIPSQKSFAHSADSIQDVANLQASL
jgi:hypothetical protein